ncbi:DNA helicase UvrD [Candidatus Uhrbacteria bacterium]|nr:DNA helicase UvrD [Candidatus Uhrbacteria bacterium]
MRLVTDLHIHSRWSRSCSKDLTLPNIAAACGRKGIQLVGTADALHPAWRASIGDELTEAGEGVFALRAGSSPTRFILSTEISCIYKRGGKVRRLHHIVLFPSLAALDRLIASLTARDCNLKSDGRPIIGLDSEELLKLVIEADEKCLLIPAHAWTPWFSIFGSKSGFDSIQECFGDLAPLIPAVETGLSSDPAMNWRLSALDKIFLVSNSDAHSLDNLGREANVFEMAEPSYFELRRILVEHDTDKFLETYEFFPEEGKYHADGHRDCGFWCGPFETKRLKGLCPKCGKPLTVGVLNRVDELADRPENPFRPTGSPPYRSIVPLAELVGDALGVGKVSKRVKTALDGLLKAGGNEFHILLDMPPERIAQVSTPEIASAIQNMRAGLVEIRPGYDGEFGHVKVSGIIKKKQGSLL